MMLENGGGSIVNCSSVAGLVGVPDMPAYAASKHGVIGLTKSASLEFAKKNIRVNSICPGVIQTPMIDRRFSSDRGAFEKMNESEPMGRIGRAEEVSSAVIWLSSDQASFVTGHSLVVDGGWIAQ
jgi:NAD(P)-dependent dehydrogenase (short-subunit alcohol dehydrogenase family)